MLRGIKYMENASQVIQLNPVTDVGTEGIIDKIKEIFKELIMPTHKITTISFLILSMFLVHLLPSS